MTTVLFVKDNVHTTSVLTAAVAVETAGVEGTQVKVEAKPEQSAMCNRGTRAAQVDGSTESHRRQPAACSCHSSVA